MPHKITSSRGSNESDKPTVQAQRAIQFDKATTGFTIHGMRDQVLGTSSGYQKAAIADIAKANVEILFADESLVTGSRYIVVVGEIAPEESAMLYYQVVVVKLSIEGTCPVMQGPIEPTLFSAYRRLLRYTMQDIGKKLEESNEKVAKEHTRSRSLEQEIDRIAVQKPFRVLGIDK